MKVQLSSLCYMRLISYGFSRTTDGYIYTDIAQAELSFYSFKYEKRLGRRRLGILPTEVPKLMPEAFSTVTMPIVLPDGSRSSVEGVPNVDWSHLFAHTFVVTQVLAPPARIFITQNP